MYRSAKRTIVRRITGSAVLVLGVSAAGVGIASASQHHSDTPATSTTLATSSATTPAPLDNTSSSELVSIEGTVSSVLNSTIVLNEKDGTSISVETTPTTFFTTGDASATFAAVQPGSSIEVHGTPGSAGGPFVATSVTIDSSTNPATLTPVVSTPGTTYSDDAQGDDQSTTTSPSDDQGGDQSTTTSPSDDQGGDQGSSFVPGQGDATGGPASISINASGGASDNGSNAAGSNAGD